MNGENLRTDKGQQAELNALLLVELKKLTGNQSVSIFGAGGPYAIQGKTILATEDSVLSSIKVDGVERIALANVLAPYNFTGVTLKPTMPIPCGDGEQFTSITVVSGFFAVYNV